MTFITVSEIKFKFVLLFMIAESAEFIYYTLESPEAERKEYDALLLYRVYSTLVFRGRKIKKIRNNCE